MGKVSFLTFFAERVKRIVHRLFPHTNAAAYGDSILSPLLKRAGGFCSTGSQISLLGLKSSGSECSSDMPACHWFTATPDPSKSLYKPFVFSKGKVTGTISSKIIKFRGLSRETADTNKNDHNQLGWPERFSEKESNETFLDATTHLYKRSCPSLGPSVGPSVRRSVPCYFRTTKNVMFRVPMMTKFHMV